MANIIFDFDGTIADTFELVVAVTYEVTGVKPLPKQQIAKLRELPILVAVQKLGSSIWQIPKLLLQVRPRMRSRMADVKTFEGISSLLESLRSEGHSLSILSSNNASNVAAFLHAHHLDSYFGAIHTVLYGNAWFKARALKKVLRRSGANPANSYYVGNEPLDVIAAHRAGMRAIAVTWGGQNKPALLATKPDSIVGRPSELAAILGEHGK